MLQVYNIKLFLLLNNINTIKGYKHIIEMNINVHNYYYVCLSVLFPLKALELTGLRRTDPRLKEAVGLLQQIERQNISNNKAVINREQFRR